MLKVFIADDDSTIRKGLRTIIERNRTDFCVVGEAVNGSDALKAIMETRPDVLVTDIKMPVMDGVELVKQLKGLDSKLRIIVLSGFDEYAFVRETMKLGVIDYILKPVNKKIFFDLLDNIAKDIAADHEKEKQLKAFNENMSISMNMLREKLLTQIIRKNIEDFNNVKQFSDVAFELGDCYVLAALGEDDLLKPETKQLYENKSMMLDIFWEQVTNLLESICPKKHVLVARMEETVIILFTCPDDRMNVLKILECLMDSYIKKNGRTLTVGVSPSFDLIDKASLAYAQAISALERRFYNGKNAIITYTDEVPANQNVRDDEIDDYIGQLLNYIDLADSHKVNLEVAAVIEKVRSLNLEPRRFRECLRSLVGRVFIQQREFAITMEGYLVNGLSLMKYIDGLDTFSELKEYVCKAFTDITELIYHDREAKSRRIIEQAKDFINKNFRQGINLKMVAEHIFLNASYLSDLFKKETGKNFTDYLVEIRMKEAKKLLAKPDSKVYEIAGMVGYDDPTSFNRSFKKVFGVSPTEYKKLIK